MKLLSFALLFLTLPFARLAAQTMASGVPFGAQPSLSDSSAPTPSPSNRKTASATPQASGSTTIDSLSMDYEEKSRVAIFTGDDYGVFVKDPQFTINCNKVTAYLRKPGATPAAPGAKGKSSTNSHSSRLPGAKASPSPDPAKAGSLQRAIAEGTTDEPVVIVQDKPGINGQPPQHSVGIAEKADYNADTGEIKLSGWPSVTQGSDKQVATSRNTVMIMNKDGGTMKTYGPSHSEFVQQAPPKNTGADTPSPAHSP